MEAIFEEDDRFKSIPQSKVIKALDITCVAVNFNGKDVFFATHDS